MIIDYSPLEKAINYQFKEPRILEEALTHPSFLNENKVGHDSYQRLEFLGDAILELVVSAYLFNNLPDIREGRLTEIRAAMVRTENLAKCARKLTLGERIKISKGEELNQGRDNNNILADTFEALIAAIYLDSHSLIEVETFFDRFVKEELNSIIANKLYLDAKTQLQELIQSIYKVTPIYKVKSEKFENNTPFFEVGVFVNDKCFGLGSGRSKRLAEQEAAKNALPKIKTV